VRMSVAAMFLMCALLSTAAEAPSLDEKLFGAAWEGKPDAVRILLKKGANANAKKGAQTVLMAAAAGGNPEVIHLLLAAGSAVNARDKDDVTPLMLAALGRSGDAVELLIQAGADVNQKTRSGHTALMMAALVRNTAAMQSLLRAKADVGIEDEDGWTALNWARVREKAEVIGLLEQAGAREGPARFAPRAFTAAAGRGDAPTVGRLIETGVVVNATDQQGFTALVAAAQEGHLEVVRLLLSSGADPNITDNFRPRGLLMAAREGSTVGFNLSGVIEIPRNQGRTPLQMASRFGHREVIEILLKAGANVNAKFGGFTPLLLACEKKGNTEVIRRLLDAGADVNAQDHEHGMSALMKASSDDEVETVGLLIARGAKTNLKDKDGHTALWWGRDNKAVVALLGQAAAKGKK